MKLLWITNSLLPEVTAALNGQNILKGSGGWVLALADALANRPGVDISIAAISPLVNQLTLINGNRITYFVIPASKSKDKYNRDYEIAFRDVYLRVTPDVVHIHGTEYPHSLAAFRACGSEHTIISLQGLVSSIAPLYLGGIDKRTIRRNITFHDVIRDNLFQQQRKMVRRGQYEIQLLRAAKYVIGRTHWDQSHLWSINPDAKYFHCDEVLRHEFYEREWWQYEKCKPHSVFVGQGYYPLKGLHILIEALGIVKERYSDTVLRIAGADFIYDKASLSNSLRRTAYGKIIKQAIRRNNLDGSVYFTGLLSAEDMKREYLSCNVFICPSIIENSPNSLCEAQILGVPVIASYVGGIPDLMKNDEGHLYRYEEVAMLAKMICDAFSSPLLLNGEKMRVYAMERHNTKRITDKLMSIYESVQDE